MTNETKDPADKLAGKEVYVTKDALKKGIRRVKVESNCLLSDPDGHMIRVLVGAGSEWYFKGEWFPTFKEAVADAEKRRERAIAAARKRIKKLKAIKFDKDAE